MYHYVCRLHSHVRAAVTEGYAHIARSEHRSVVYAVAHERHPVSLTPERLNVFSLSARQEVAYAERGTRRRHRRVDNRLAVARQYHRAQARTLHSLTGVVAQHVAEDDAPLVCSSGGYADHSAVLAALHLRHAYAVAFEQTRRPGKPSARLQTVARHCGDIGHRVRSRQTGSILHYGARHRMNGRALHRSHHGNVVVGESLHTEHLEASAGECSGLVERHGVNIRHGVYASASLEQYAPARRRSYSGEIAERHAYDKSARTGDDKEYECAPEPQREVERTGKSGEATEPWHEHHEHRQREHHGRIDTCEAAYEQFSGSLARRRFLHKAQYAGNSRIARGTCHAQPYHVSCGYHSGRHLAAGGYHAWQRLTCEHGGVER